MGMSNPGETVDAFHDLRQQNLGLLVSFFVLPLHVGDNLYRLRKRLVAFGETIQTLVNIHSPIVYPRRDTSHRAAGRARGSAGGAGFENFVASIGTFGCTSLSSKFSFPSSHVTVQRKGILTPATSR